MSSHYHLLVRSDRKGPVNMVSATRDSPSCRGCRSTQNATLGATYAYVTTSKAHDSLCDSLILRRSSVTRVTHSLWTVWESGWAHDVKQNMCEQYDDIAWQSRAKWALRPLIQLQHFHPQELLLLQEEIQGLVMRLRKPLLEWERGSLSLVVRRKERKR